MTETAGFIRPTQLADFVQSRTARVNGERIEWILDQASTMADESRVGFVGLTAMVECTRELHWDTTLRLAPEIQHLDSTAIQLHALYRRPVDPSNKIISTYSAAGLTSKGYELGVGIYTGAPDSATALLASNYRIQLRFIWLDTFRGANLQDNDLMAIKASFRTAPPIDLPDELDLLTT